MNLTFISYNYPTLFNPANGAFVRELVRGLATRGNDCLVVNPIAWVKRDYGVVKVAKTSCDLTTSPHPIRELHPRFLSLSSGRIAGLDRSALTRRFFLNAARNALQRRIPRPYLIYGHFLALAGFSAVKIGEALKIPTVVAVGESEIDALFSAKALEEYRRAFRSVGGIIAVSNANREYCLNCLGIPEARIRVIPNAVDLSKFTPLDKSRMRAKYNLPQERVIAAFVGHFIERKGPNRLLEALKTLDNIGVIFVGSGPLKLEGKGILFKGAVPHDQVAELLSAADFFVLPTVSEGFCNAIVEALACGLPVISSDRRFNDDILTDDCSIRIDPEDIGAIRNAILHLGQNAELRSQMSNSARQRALLFDIRERAAKVEQWLTEVAADHNS